ncbi:MAG: hypothetical protein ABR954_00080 [Dehalococcoidales bacterium]
MKISKIIRIFGVAFILTLLFTMLPVSPAFSTAITYTYSIAISPTQGDIGTTVSYNGVSNPAPTSATTASIYFSPNNLSIGANLSSASTYIRLVNERTIPSFDDVGPNAGNYTGDFTIPSSIPVSTDPLVGGNVSQDVSAGTYYVYVTITSGDNTSGVAAKATFTLTQPTLDPLSPTSGPSGTSVVVSGHYFPNSAQLTFKFDTTTVSPTSGHTSTTSSGTFLSYITIPSGYLPGQHTLYITAGSDSSAITLSATFTITAVSSASIDSVFPQTGMSGTLVEVHGSNFPAGAQITFNFDDNSVAITNGDTSTSTGGDFISRITIPSATTGSHTIRVTVGGATDFKFFTVTGTPPTTPPPTLTTPISIDPSSGSVNSSVSVSGSSFLANHNVDITFNGTLVKQTNTNDAGAFLTSFQVPSKPSGNHTVAATDGTNTGTKVFTIESTAPQIPQPSLPLMKEAVSSPVTFDWADVTDPSAPVTYKLQIATSANFDADSIIINKTGLTVSQYTLSDDDMKKLSSDVPTYYWREKAVDAAFNESGWTGASEFSLAKPFSFTGWPLYGTIGIGALLLFLIGIWIGRKTAYSY